MAIRVHTLTVWLGLCEQYFDLAVVEGYEEYGELVVHLRWAMSGLTCTIPYSADTVESIDSPQKRKRTTLVDLGVVRVKKEKKSKVSDSNALDHRKTNAESNLTMDPIKAQLLKEIKDSEEVSFQSLVPHLSQLKPFLSLKIQNKFAETNAAQPLKGNCSEVTADSPVSFAHSQYQRNYGLDVQPISTPINLRATMRSYQEFGLSWLVDRYDKAIHCILADEMGLGKTIQTIALICYLKEVRNVSGTHLVVVPLSVMFNWMNECRKFCPFLRLLRVHTSSLAEAVALRTKMADIESYDVAITSYETLIQNSMQYSFQRMAWRTIVLDEGHRIKNLDTFVAKACLRLR